jgi:hypothetical protein
MDKEQFCHVTSYCHWSIQYAPIRAKIYLHNMLHSASMSLDERTVLQRLATIANMAADRVAEKK